MGTECTPADGITDNAYGHKHADVIDECFEAKGPNCRCDLYRLAAGSVDEFLVVTECTPTQ